MDFSLISFHNVYFDVNGINPTSKILVASVQCSKSAMTKLNLTLSIFSTHQRKKKINCVSTLAFNLPATWRLGRRFSPSSLIACSPPARIKLVFGRERF